MGKTHKLRVNIGRTDGKAIWRDVGVVVVSEETIKVKLDLIPAGHWDGWGMVWLGDKDKAKEET